MGYYSQNNEDQEIAKYFAGQKLNLLSIGENDGKTLSNCRYFLEQGWTGILVEPSFSAFDRLLELYWGTYNVWCFNVALGNVVGEADLFESGEHLGNGDVALLSTLNIYEMNRWANTKNTFKKIKTLVWTFDVLQKKVELMERNNKYQFINIDAEGLDVDILKQIDLNEVDCQCLCIEHNSVLSVVQEIREYCNFFGLTKEIGYNQENIILAR